MAKVRRTSASLSLKSENFIPSGVSDEMLTESDSMQELSIFILRSSTAIDVISSSLSQVVSSFLYPSHSTKYLMPDCRKIHSDFLSKCYILIILSDSHDNTTIP